MRTLRFIAMITVPLLTGCERAPVAIPAKAPRPVTTFTLEKKTPEASFVVSGAVKSWKTEKIGFEVSGRVQSVLEPGNNIEGQIKDTQGNLISPGVPLAKIDPARYEIAVETAKADLEVAELEREVIEIRINDSIPTEIESATADVGLAETDFNRKNDLREQNAISQSEFEDAENRLKTLRARLLNLQANLKQANAERKAAIAQVKRAKQSLRDAERDLSNTTLYASYHGQISETLVVPGSVVSRGSPVLTLQMMTPIKIEVEVSAKQSREILRRKQVPVTFTMPDGTTQREKAIVYVVDPSANPATRTFTLSLMVLNKQFRPTSMEEPTDRRFALAETFWPLNLNEIISGDSSLRFVDENIIETDTDGPYVWLIQNARFGETIPKVLKVQKEPIQLLDLRVPFLGNWIFQQVQFDNPLVDSQSLLAAKLEFFNNDRSNWDGESVIIDAGQQWMLRPGDLVKVDLVNEDLENGYFIPVEAIYEELNSTYVFIVAGDSARRTEVRAFLPSKLDTGSMIRIEPLDAEDFPPETRIVVGGVHFLKDGDRVNPVSEFDASAIPDAPAVLAEPPGGQQ